MEALALDEAQERCLNGVAFPHGSLVTSHEDGCTEPWIAQLVSAILVAHGGTTVLETGGFRGTTSAWLALTLQKMGGGNLIVCEIDAERHQGIEARLSALPIPNVVWRVEGMDALNRIAALPDKSLDIAWVDDDHQEHHVEQEIVALWDKVRPGGLILFHDVFGSCNLQRVVKKYGGVSLDLPRLGPAGGLGIISIPRG